MYRSILATTFLLLAGGPLLLLAAETAVIAQRISGPYDLQVADNVNKLSAPSVKVRAGAACALGFLRAYSAEAALIRRLDDESFEVRRQAAMALAWCGGRVAVPPLLAALDDEDWIVRQAAHVSLTNLTGMEFPLNSLASPDKRGAQAEQWRRWWATLSMDAGPPDRPPAEVLQLLGTPLPGSGGLSAGGGRVFAVSNYTLIQ